ncbi:MAG: sigma-70 family RNA polymerase sigma factor [Lachnospiraceae bacterium]|nr:sigma-70 family RNA polymerase sigma factor [Lachnospiraceae bacterium]
MVINDINNEILIQKAKMGNPDAFTELMNSQMQNMYRTAKAILMNDEDAADAIQDTLLICWKKINELKVDRYFKTWMTKILINNCYGIIRRNRRITYTDELPEKVIEDNASNIEWRETLSAIDEKYRVVLILFYSEGFRTKEIAKILGITDSAVRTRLSRGREQLREYYNTQ